MHINIKDYYSITRTDMYVPANISNIVTIVVIKSLTVSEHIQSELCVCR